MCQSPILDENMVEILVEPTNKNYFELIDLLIDKCDYFILVKRNQLYFNDNCDNILEMLKPYLIKKLKLKEWPGTKLFGHSAIVYYFRCNLKTSEILKNACNKLYSWMSPNLPEDLCFFILNDPFFVTITHENIGYFDDKKNNLELIEKIVSRIKLATST
jgi:hypothetical protein